MIMMGKSISQILVKLNSGRVINFRFYRTNSFCVSPKSKYMYIYVNVGKWQRTKNIPELNKKLYAKGTQD